MLRKLLIFILLAIFPVYVFNRNGRENTGKPCFTWQIPSVIMGFVSMIINSKHSKKIFCVFVTSVLLTLEGLLLYVYINETRQRSPEFKHLGLEKSGFKATLKTDSQENGYLTDFVSNLCSTVRNASSKLWSGITRELHKGLRLKNVTGFKNSPCVNESTYRWYLNVVPPVPQTTAVTYPCALQRYFEEVKQNNHSVSLMNYEWARIASFAKFPMNSPARPVRLAQSGFFYTGTKDNVRCFSCNVEYENWKDGDVVSAIHKQLAPSCRFLTGEDQTNIPIHDNNSVVQENLSLPEASEATGTAEAAASAEAKIDSATTNEATASDNTLLVKQHRACGRNDEFSDRKQRARHPEYADVKKRSASFNDWKYDSVVSYKCLIEAGFAYAGVGDCVRCFHCGIGLRNWAKGDDPWAEHARWSPKCEHLLENKGLPFIRRHKTQADGEYCGETSISESIKEHEVKPPENIKPKQLTRNKASNIQEQPVKTEGERKSTEQPPASQLKKVGKQIREENQRLKSQLTCKICMDRSTNTVFLPCGHLVTCDVCSKNLKKCAMCRAKIKSSIRAFMS